MISLTTFEATLRRLVLDVVYAQWGYLGAAWSNRSGLEVGVIDPEGLLWCSLEFVEEEPRLRECVEAWVWRYRSQLIRQRLTQSELSTDPRVAIWRETLARATSSTGRAAEVVEGGGGRDLDVSPKASDFVRERRERGSRLGDASAGGETLLVRTRDVFGGDPRAFLVVYLLANPHGGRLRDVAVWSRYSYRSLSTVAALLARQNVIEVDRGECRLLRPDVWRTLLVLGGEPVGLVDWFGAFESLVSLLRVLRLGIKRGSSLENSAVQGLIRECRDGLNKTWMSKTPGEVGALRQLIEATDGPVALVVR